jgi:hypothetical protein
MRRGGVGDLVFFGVMMSEIPGLQIKQKRDLKLLCFWRWGFSGLGQGSLFAVGQWGRVVNPRIGPWRR